MKLTHCVFPRLTKNATFIVPVFQDSNERLVYFPDSSGTPLAHENTDGLIDLRVAEILGLKVEHLRKLDDDTAKETFGFFDGSRLLFGLVEDFSHFVELNRRWATAIQAKSGPVFAAVKKQFKPDFGLWATRPLGISLEKLQNAPSLYSAKIP